jgi:hypothetical protein
MLSTSYSTAENNCHLLGMYFHFAMPMGVRRFHSEIGELPKLIEFQAVGFGAWRIPIAKAWLRNCFVGKESQRFW